MFGYIYKTTDKLTGKIYVGKHHSSDFVGLKYIGSGKIIKNIKAKCIRENIDLADRFDVELLDSADSKDDLDMKEIYWIDHLNARDPNIGYNLREGGDCGPGGPRFMGHKHSAETREKMSRDRCGSKNSNYGNHWTQNKELRELHSILSSGSKNGMYGKKHSDKSKHLNSEAHKGKIAISNVCLNSVKMITIDELDSYLNQGWIRGNIHTHNK